MNRTGDLQLLLVQQQIIINIIIIIIIIKAADSLNTFDPHIVSPSLSSYGTFTLNPSVKYSKCEVIVSLCVCVRHATCFYFCIDIYIYF